MSKLHRTLASLSAGEHVLEGDMTELYVALNRIQQLEAELKRKGEALREFVETTKEMLDNGPRLGQWRWGRFQTLIDNAREALG